MIKQKWFHSLQVKFLLVLLLALTAGLLSGAAVCYLGDCYIYQVYLSEEASAARCRESMSLFRTFVQDQQLSVQEDAREIIRWAKGQEYLYLIVQDGDTIIIDSGWWDDSSYYTIFEDQESDEDNALSDYYSTFGDSGETSDTIVEESYSCGLGTAPVAFADGIYQVYLYDFSEEPLYDTVTVLSYVIGILIFVLIMIFYHQSTIRQIIKLTREVENIAGGNLDGPITVRSLDEFGVLAQHVDSMRNSIMREMRAEQEAWNANSDLITRMSHDIRTPLTVLLGFLDLLSEGNYSQDATYTSYLDICKKNAYQLKELADKLFQYFLVFGHQEYALELEIADAQVLLGQMIGEHLVLLEEQHWQVENHRLEQPALIQVDPFYVKRLFDNLFSNIEKYADPTRPVEICQSMEENHIRIRIHNFVPPNPNPVESTNIGLKTCERIVQQMGGVFQFEKSVAEFLVSFTIPIYQQQSGPENPTPPAKFFRFQLMKPKFFGNN